MALSKGKKSIASEIMDRLEAKQPKRTKITLVLNGEKFQEFKALCRERDRFPSDVLDEFIAMFIENPPPKPKT